MLSSIIVVITDRHAVIAIIIVVITDRHTCALDHGKWQTTDQQATGMGLMTINKGTFRLLDSRVNFPYRHSVF